MTGMGYTVHVILHLEHIDGVVPRSKDGAPSWSRVSKGVVTRLNGIALDLGRGVVVAVTNAELDEAE